MTSVNAQVDAFMRKAPKWRKEFEELRRILLACELTEELKWRAPCYTFQNSNVAIIQGFKEYSALLFFKGALLKDPNGILIKHGEHQQAARQIRFTNACEITGMEGVLKAYVRETIEVEKAGLKVKYKKTSEFKMPEEFQRKLDAIPSLKAAFEALTPGRQRAYLLYFSAAKQPKTREARVAKCMPRILKGKGLEGFLGFLWIFG